MENEKIYLKIGEKYISHHIYGYKYIFGTINGKDYNLINIVTGSNMCGKKSFKKDKGNWFMTKHEYKYYKLALLPEDEKIPNKLIYNLFRIHNDMIEI